jgi:predicted DNA repair protein MutK
VSGFLALLDDVAAIAKLAAAQVDDIAAHATKAGGSAAVSWLVMAFLDAGFGFLLGSILIPVVNVLLVPIGVLFPEK